MKSVLLIGLGRFGRHLAMQLNELGHQVMAVDKDEERVNECMPFVTNAQIGDSTRVDFLRSLGVSNYDVCYVTISGDFQNSLETTSLLKELGANYVVSRAERDVQAKFLLRNGADAVAYPEKQLAKWAAIRYIDGQQRAEDVAHIFRVARPVGPELEFEGDPGHDAEDEVDEEQLSPKLDHSFVHFIARADVERLHDGEKNHES